MYRLGVPTTRALAAIATGDSVFRNDREPGAVMVRVADSHLRFGSIQYFAMTRDGEDYPNWLATLPIAITKR